MSSEVIRFIIARHVSVAHRARIVICIQGSGLKVHSHDSQTQQSQMNHQLYVQWGILLVNEMWIQQVLIS